MLQWELDRALRRLVLRKIVPEGRDGGSAGIEAYMRFERREPHDRFSIDGERRKVVADRFARPRRAVSYRLPHLAQSALHVLGKILRVIGETRRNDGRQCLGQDGTARSKRSRFMTFSHAVTKARTKRSSSMAYTSASARSCEFEPKTRSQFVPVQVTSPVRRSRPS